MLERKEQTNLFMVIFNWKGLMEENFLYTEEELRLRDSAACDMCLSVPAEWHSGQDFAGNKTTVVKMVESDDELKDFVLGKFNESNVAAEDDEEDECDDSDWYYRNAIYDLYERTALPFSCVMDDIMKNPEYADKFVLDSQGYTLKAC